MVSKFLAIVLVLMVGFSADGEGFEVAGWKMPFERMEGLEGAYTSCVVLEGEQEQVFAWNNYDYLGLEAGISRFEGNWNQMKPGDVVIKNSIIDDLFNSEGELHEARFFTRPVVVYSKKEDRYYAIAHVAKGYPPEDGRVYPAFLSSEKGNPDEWNYHGMLKGEIWEQFGPGGTRVWGSGMGFVLNDEASNEINHEDPASNRFLFYSDGYGRGLVLLYSSTGEQWYFARDDGEEDNENDDDDDEDDEEDDDDDDDDDNNDNDGEHHRCIRDLRPAALESVNLIFPVVVKTHRYYHCWSTDGWPPNGIWHLFSEDGLNWEIWGGLEQPEIPRKKRFKNMSVYYDAQQDQIHGLLSVQHRGGIYHKYHSVFIEELSP